MRLQNCAKIQAKKTLRISNQYIMLKFSHFLSPYRNFFTTMQKFTYDTHTLCLTHFISRTVSKTILILLYLRIEDSLRIPQVLGSGYLRQSLGGEKCIVHTSSVCVILSFDQSKWQNFDREKKSEQNNSSVISTLDEHDIKPSDYANHGVCRRSW